MSAFQNPNVATIDLTLDDELDVINASGPLTITTNEGLGRLRTRHSLGDAVANPPKRKRARTFSESTIENHRERSADKRQKTEDKKAVRLLSLPLLDKAMGAEYSCSVC